MSHHQQQRQFERRRRRRKRSETRSSLFTHLLLPLLIVADDGEGVGNNNDGQSNVKRKGFQNVQTFCRKNQIKVTGLWLTCDTPGAYYYGSTAYRDSEVCMAGDKATIQVDFYMPSGFEDQSIGLQIESGVYDSFQTVDNVSSMCQSLTVVPVYNQEDECPNPGYYTLTTYFEVPSIRDSSLQYTPDIKLTFVDSEGRRVGCSTTGTIARHRSHDERAANGLIALGISVIVFLAVFGLLLYLSYRRKKRLEKVFEKRRQNYHYFKTLPSGQVVPLPGTKTAALPKQSPVSPEAMNISNPSYNETHLPTRPII